MKAVCGLGRTNYGGLRNVRPPIIDPPIAGEMRDPVILLTLSLLRREYEFSLMTSIHFF